MTQTKAQADAARFNWVKLVEATLEMGRNWLLAVAVASFAAANWHREVALESMLPREVVLYGGIIFSLIWMMISILRFLLVANVPVGSRLQTFFAWLIIGVLVVSGFFLIREVGRFADNTHAVSFCTTFEEAPQHKLHQNAVCQRLYQHRSDKLRRMLGE